MLSPRRLAVRQPHRGSIIADFPDPATAVRRYVLGRATISVELDLDLVADNPHREDREILGCGRR